MKRAFAMVILFMLLVTYIPFTTVVALDFSTNDNTIVLKFSFKKPKTSYISIDGQQYTRVSIDGLSNSEEIGHPSLPKRIAKILLPPNSNVKSVDIIKSGKGTISNINNIEFSPIEYLPIGYNQAISMVDKMDFTGVEFDETDNAGFKYEIRFGSYSSSLYDKKSIYPRETVANLGIQYKLGFPILFVEINPAQYDPSTNSVVYYTDITLKVNINKDESIKTNELFRGTPRDYATIASFVDNPSMLESWQSNKISSSFENSNQVGNLLIITTEELKNYQGEYSLYDLAEVHREEDSVEVYIETVESIYSRYEPVDLPKESDFWWEKNPNNYQIRECIKDYYKNKNVDFVLLVGDDNREWEDDWIFPFFGGPLIRTSHNVKDQNEVPTWQKYLYTLLIYLIPIECLKWETRCKNETNNTAGPHIDGPVKPEGPFESDVIEPIRSDDEESTTDNMQPDAQKNNSSNGLNPDKSESTNYNNTTKENANPMSKLRILPISKSKTLSSANEVQSVGSVIPIKNYNPCKNCEATKKSNYTKTSNCTKVCTMLGMGKPKLIFKKDYTTASDLPYACLDKNNDRAPVKNVNELQNSPPRYFTDLLSEVYVGRAPVDDAKDLQNFVRKTIDYIKASDSSYKCMLMVSEYLGFGGIVEYADSMLDELVEKCSNHGYTTVGIPSSNFTIRKLYESKLRWNGNNLIEEIQSGYSNLVNHIGHANVDFNMKLGTPGYNEHGAVSVYNFKNSYTYPIFYSQGCFAGAFDSGQIIGGNYKYSDGRPMYGDCIAEYMTVKNQYGGVAWIGNSHFGWGRYASTDGPSQRYHREFIDAIFGEGKSMLGIANQDSKEDNVGSIENEIMLWLYYCINLIGDPMLKVKGAPFTPYKITSNANDIKEGNDGTGDKKERNAIERYTLLEKIRSLFKRLLETFVERVRSTKA